MKCVKKGKEVQRVTDDEAVNLLKSGWVYCPKSHWKIIRDGKMRKDGTATSTESLDNVQVSSKKVEKLKTKGLKGQKVQKGQRHSKSKQKQFENINKETVGQSTNAGPDSSEKPNKNKSKS